MRRHARGFTLVEILVATAISAILAAMAFTAMSQAMDNRERVRASQRRLVELQFAIRSLVQDFSQAAPRPVRVPVGEGYEPAVLGLRRNSSVAVLTRNGWSNPAGLQRSGLQRVRYQLRDGVLYRDYWLVLDAQTEPQPVPRALLDDVRDFTIRYLNDGLQWQETWPPQQPTDANSAQDMRLLRWRPLAVEVTIELADWGRITRIIEVTG
jgi:general secretion pathway protein J